METHIRSLKALGVASVVWWPTVICVLDKLPPELCFIVSRKVSDSTLDVDSLLNIVEELIAREQMLNATQVPHVKVKINLSLLQLHFSMAHNLPLPL